MPYITPPPISPLPEPLAVPVKASPPKEKISSWSVFLAFLLIVVLVWLSEYIFIDTNKVFNPSYYVCTQPDGALLGQSCLRDAYEQTIVVLQAKVVAPVIIVLLSSYLLTRRREFASDMVVIGRSTAIFIIWLSVRQFYVTARYLLEFHHTAGVYVILVTLALVLTTLIMIVQRRFNRPVREQRRELDRRKQAQERGETIEPLT